MLPEYQKQLEQLQRNADALVQDARATLAAEFAAIDKAHTIGPGSRKWERPSKRYEPTLNDMAQNNPALRKLLRDLQAGRM